MSKGIVHTERKHRMTVSKVVIGGIVVFFLTVLIAGRLELRNTEKLAEDVLLTLKNQCSSYERLMAADRTKSLFRLIEMIQDFSSQMEENPELLTDKALEEYVDSMRLSGLAVLDRNYALQVSGYTKQFRNADWMYTPNGAKFADIMEHPNKVYAERIEVDGVYYDVCAVARKDAPGIVIGFYEQPTGMIVDTENDLESLLTGLKLERGGNYVITENNIIRASSESAMKDENLSDNIILQSLSQIEKDNHLHLFYADKKHYWGYRSGYEGYKLFIYYPFFAPISSALMTGVIVMAGFAVFFLLLFAVRNRALYENQERLKKSNYELTETVKILKSLETIYFSLFRVDLENDEYRTISISTKLMDKVPQEGVYTQLKQMFLHTMTISDYRDEVEYRMSKDFIQDALCKDNITDIRKSFYTDFEAVEKGQTKWCRVSVTVVDFDEEGKPIHVLVLLQDVDKEKAKEAEYQTRILNESQKARMANNAKTDFLRRISHDVRTPLNGIRGYIDMANHEPEDLALQKYCREKALVSLDTLFELVNSVLEMSDMEGHEVQVEEIPFDLDVILKEVDTVVKPQAIAKNISCEILQEDALTVSHLIGSPRHVNQIFMNLASNGVKYGKQDGYFHLGVKLISKTKENVTYEFCFEDNGIGMSEEFQKHIYEPFVQEAASARSVYEGTGLGLSIVKKLVDALGGTIAVRSEKNVGTTFLVQLTFRIDNDFCEPVEKEVDNSAISLGQVHILLVEDNELNMEIAEFFLTEHDAKITKAWNGREAVDAFLASKPGDFDLILMDIMMPEMDGLEACRTIRAFDREDAKCIPIAAMSANVLEEDIQRCREAGMNAQIAKPMEEKKLLEVITKLLGVPKFCCTNQIN